MEYSGEGVSVYAEAKGEYTRQLCQYLTPALQKYFLELLTTAKERETDAKKHLVAFQTLLEGISEWNVDKVQRETQALAMSTQCDYLEELLTAVFIAHTKVLSAIRLTNRQKKLQITIPKLEHFLHRTMTECARLLWSNTFLFATTGAALERQKNMRQIEALITEGVLQGVRGMLPVKSILREYLAADESEAEEEEAEAEEEEAEEAEGEAEVAPQPEATTSPDMVGPTGLADPAVVVAPEETGPTGAVAAPEETPSIPTIVLDTVSSAVESLFSSNSAVQAPQPVPVVRPPTPVLTMRPPTPVPAAEPDLVEMDDIPAEEEKILEEEPPLFADSDAAPLSIDDGAIEFEEL
jgi:hypothetical protein